MEQYLLQMKQSFISVRNIKWKFNIDAAPWWGEMREQLVVSVKGCVEKVIDLQRLSFIKLRT